MPRFFAVLAPVGILAVLVGRPLASTAPNEPRLGSLRSTRSTPASTASRASSQSRTLTNSRVFGPPAPCDV